MCYTIDSITWAGIVRQLIDTVTDTVTVDVHTFMTSTELTPIVSLIYYYCKLT